MADRELAARAAQREELRERLTIVADRMRNSPPQIRSVEIRLAECPDGSELLSRMPRRSPRSLFCPELPRDVWFLHTVEPEEASESFDALFGPASRLVPDILGLDVIRNETRWFGLPGAVRRNSLDGTEWAVFFNAVTFQENLPEALRATNGSRMYELRPGAVAEPLLKGSTAFKRFVEHAEKQGAPPDALERLGQLPGLFTRTVPDIVSDSVILLNWLARSIDADAAESRTEAGRHEASLAQAARHLLTKTDAFDVHVVHLANRRTDADELVAVMSAAGEIGHGCKQLIADDCGSLRTQQRLVWLYRCAGRFVQAVNAMKAGSESEHCDATTWFSLVDEVEQSRAALSIPLECVARAVPANLGELLERAEWLGRLARDTVEKVQEVPFTDGQSGEVLAVYREFTMLHCDLIWPEFAVTGGGAVFSELQQYADTCVPVLRSVAIVQQLMARCLRSAESDDDDETRPDELSAIQTLNESIHVLTNNATVSLREFHNRRKVALNDKPDNLTTVVDRPVPERLIAVRELRDLASKVLAVFKAWTGRIEEQQQRNPITAAVNAYLLPEIADAWGLSAEEFEATVVESRSLLNHCYSLTIEDASIEVAECCKRIREGASSLERHVRHIEEALNADPQTYLSGDGTQEVLILDTTISDAYELLRHWLCPNLKHVTQLLTDDSAAVHVLKSPEADGDGSDESRCEEQVLSDWLAPSDPIPAEYKFGPLEGTQTRLRKAMNLSDNRQFRSKVFGRGLAVGVKLGATDYQLWFRDKNQFKTAEAKLDRDQR